jgi:gliding motility-associated lipoprotein GldH
MFSSLSNTRPATYLCKNSCLKTVFLSLLTCILLASCVKSDAFEKNVGIPGHEWSSSFKPLVDVTITDTISSYTLYVVLRHTDAYRYNNIWINLYTQVPGEQLRKQRFDLRLATDDRGWLGSGMDDIFEHRIAIAPIRFPKPGKYTFQLEQIMRDDPLPHIMNAGIRLERAK